MSQKSRTKSALKSADGQGKIVKTQDRLERWRQHFESVLSIQTTVSEVTLDSLKGCAEAGGCPEANSEVVNDGLVCPPTAEEVAEAVKQLKGNKAPGVDEITAELLKLGGEIMVQVAYPAIPNHMA